MATSGEKTNLPSKAEIETPLCFRKVRRKVDRYLGQGSRKQDLQPYEFGPKHLKFMEVFTETLDHKEACKQSGLTYAQIQKNEYMMNEINLTLEAASFKHRVKAAMGTHQRLMSKFEKDYDDTGNPKMKAGLAATLAKMSEASLRSQGEFNDDKSSDNLSGLKLVFNFGGNPERGERPVDVTVENKE